MIWLTSVWQTLSPVNWTVVRSERLTDDNIDNITGSNIMVFDIHCSILMTFLIVVSIKVVAALMSFTGWWWGGAGRVKLIWNNWETCSNEGWCDDDDDVTNWRQNKYWPKEIVNNMYQCSESEMKCTVHIVIEEELTDFTDIATMSWLTLILTTEERVLIRTVFTMTD